ncbi:MAG TPA: CopD family protein [Sporichthya sp.]|nr:CopD family protein [Sporichthya sp.]
MSRSRVPAPLVVLLIALVGALGLVGSLPAHAADDPSVRTVPAANEVVGTTPTILRIFPNAVPAAGSAPAGQAEIFDSSGEKVATSHLGPADAGGLAGALPTLEPGVHLVSWTAGEDRGAFAFEVEEGAGSPAQIVQRPPAPELKDPTDVLVEWLPLIAMMLLVGALSLRFLATGPAAARLERTSVRGLDGISLGGVDLRLARLAAAAVAVYLPTAWFAEGWQDGTEDWSAAWDAFGADGAGGVLLSRFVLAVAAAAVLVPLAVRRRRPSVPLLGVALACGLLELLLRHVPTKKPPVLTRAVFDSLMWVGHLWATALWIGGLVALVALVVASPVPADLRAGFWPTVIRRFSLTAMGSVAALVLSGLWLYWVHVDSVGQLFTTLYGNTLLVKFSIFAVLLAVGALNLFWLMPRAEVHEATADHRGMGDLMRRHFRATVALEAVLGLSLLFVANFLSGSSRNQALQASDDLFRTTAVAGSATVGLAPSGLQPGLVEYLVDVDGQAPNEVTLTFTAEGLDVPPQRVTATALGEGRYRATGMYAPVVGPWHVGVQLDDGPPATFPLTIADQPATPPKAPPKTVSATTWLFGALETLLLAALLVGSFRVSRRLSSRRPAAPPAARELIDA